MELVKTKDVRLTRTGERIIAVLGFDISGDCRGHGATVSEALRNLAAEIERCEISVWVSSPAKQYIGGGVLKAAALLLQAASTETTFGAQSSEREPCKALFLQSASAQSIGRNQICFDRTRRVQAMWRPSGEIRGCSRVPESWVNWRGAPPERGAEKSCRRSPASPL